MIYIGEKMLDCARLFAEFLISDNAQVIVYSDDIGPVFIFQCGYYKNMCNFVLRKDYRGKGIGRKLFDSAMRMCNLKVVETAHASYANGKDTIDLSTIETYLHPILLFVFAISNKSVAHINAYEQLISDNIGCSSIIDSFKEKIESGYYAEPEFDITK